jgi:aspartate/methionine/tyrosine aminotransferase
MVVINLPHNPTGYCMQAGEKQRLVEMLRTRGIILFSDEMYGQLEYDERADARPLCDLYERAVSLSGLSKSYGLPGLRIGWLASRSVLLLEPAAQLKDYTTICSPAPSEFLGHIAVSAGFDLVSRNLSLVRSNLALLEDFVSRHSGRIDLPPGMGGSVVFPRFVDGTSASDFSQRLLDERNLLLLPGDLFGMPGQFFRIGLGREDLEEGLAVVGEELEK